MNIMTAKQILFRDDARNRLLKGITTLADAVRATLGPKARTVILERSFGPPSSSTRVAVAKEIEQRSGREHRAQLARRLLPRRKPPGRHHRDPARAIVTEGMKYVAAGRSWISNLNGQQSALVTRLRSNAKPCADSSRSLVA
jgi:chaperonin GroEL